MTPPDPRVAQAVQMFQAGRQGEAVLALNQLGAAGHGEAIRILGELRWSGQIDPSPSAGRSLFEKAEQAGDLQARYYVTNLLGSGIAGRRDWAGALDRLAKEGRADPARARAAKLVAAMKLDGDGNPRQTSIGDMVSETPHVVRHRRLFTDTECAYVLGVAKAGYGPSVVYDSQRRLVRDPIRSSDGSTLHWLIEDPAIHALNRRIAAASGSEAERGEAVQVLRYEPGQEYKAHFDFVPNADNQRHLTALVWLSNDYRGGETAFLRTGLEISGKRGDAIVFRNALPDGRMDPLTEHAGRPVTKGTKYLYSRWIRERRWAP